MSQELKSKERSQRMKTRKNLLLIFLILTTIEVCLIISSCSAEQPNMAEQEVYINSDVSQYSNYAFWEKENEIRLFVTKQTKMEETNIKEEHVSIFKLEEPSEEQKQQIMEIRQGIIWYFLTVHNIDIANDLKDQKVMFYETVEEDEALGYINPNDTNMVMLNVLTEEEEEESCMFNETYIRLSLKQLGFESETAEVLTEGVINALTERILAFMSKSFSFKESYKDATNIAHQLLEADPQIVECYLGDKPIDITTRINNRLENVPRTYYEETNPAGRMENILNIMDRVWNEENLAFAGDPHALLFEAQDIAKAYCKQCNPSTEVIDYIRTKYIISDFENLEVLIDQDEGNRLSNR